MPESSGIAGKMLSSSGQGRDDAVVPLHSRRRTCHNALDGWEPLSFILLVIFQLGALEVLSELLHIEGFRISHVKAAFHELLLDWSVQHVYSFEYQ
eukprot:s1151_g17.t1